MAHRDTVVDGDGIELCRIAAHLLYLLTHDLSDLVQMGMTRDKLGKRVDDGNNRLAELLVFHTCSHPERTRSSHSPALSTDSTS